MVDRPRPKGVPAGFSIEFAMVRSSPQRFDSVLSIVVWCGVLPHHQQKTPAVRGWGFFFPDRARTGAVLASMIQPADYA
jgi:hypothetical protein